VVAQLDGFELAADAWDKHVLPARVSGYDSSLLDLLCYGGEAAWARLSVPPSLPESTLLPPRPIRATPVALMLREHSRIWRAIAKGEREALPLISDFGQHVLRRLTEHGAQFAHELCGPGESIDDVRTALAELVWAGVIASDGFSGLRAIWNDVPISKTFLSRTGRATTAPGGRWSKLADTGNEVDREKAVERYAAVLLQRYGIICRRLLVREPFPIPWRELLRVYRRLEARGEVRGGRFVSGLPGEQFALPEAVELARRIRRTPPSGETIAISAADPLNLCGILIAGDRIPAIAATRIAFRDGVPVTEPTACLAEALA
jgi:ATP-dependent Lhr-like helicase